MVSPNLKKNLGIFFKTIKEGANKNLFIWKRFLIFFKNGAKIYLPVHIILFLLRLRRSKDPYHISIWKALKGWLKSCMFAACFASSYAYTGTYFNDHIGGMTSTNTWILSGLFAFFILFEPSSRWGEMSIWVLANWFEAQTINVKKNRIGPSIPYSAVSLTF